MERTKNRPKPLKKSSKAVMKDYPTLLEKTVKTGTKARKLQVALSSSLFLSINPSF